MKFTLEIDLGSTGQLTYADVAEALANTASSLRTLRDTTTVHPESHGVYLHDANPLVMSERVGTWAITGPDGAQDFYGGLTPRQPGTLSLSANR